MTFNNQRMPIRSGVRRNVNIIQWSTTTHLLWASHLQLTEICTFKIIVYTCYDRLFLSRLNIPFSKLECFGIFLNKRATATRLIDILFDRSKMIPLSLLDRDKQLVLLTTPVNISCGICLEKMYLVVSLDTSHAYIMVMLKSYTFSLSCWSCFCWCFGIRRLYCPVMLALLTFALGKLLKQCSIIKVI